ncbi:hypothetical protein VTJ83DRAFT_3106 [Remersonia thermophila]|uniref:ribonuclease T1 n=1 Tax=Remersonia thermophila TaxID=72144 RepID=A0ABR4DDS1_9PEZI
MRGLTTALTWALLTLSSLAAADAVPALRPRQGTASLDQVTCGRNTYSRDDVDAAVAEGCRLHAAGRQVGRQNYPHAFRNFEGIQFAAAGPYQEFPILSSGALFAGNSPGPDRVVFNPKLNGECVYVGAITHTDAPTNNGFVPCVESKRSAPGGSSPSTTTTGAAPTRTSSAAADDENGAARWAGQGLAAAAAAAAGAVAGLLVL